MQTRGNTRAQLIWDRIDKSYPLLVRETILAYKHNHDHPSRDLLKAMFEKIVGDFERILLILSDAWNVCTLNRLISLHVKPPHSLYKKYRTVDVIVIV